MPTTRTVTVKSAGGDYTTLAAAEAGEQGDMVALDRKLVIECYSLSDATKVTFTGSNTDATRDITVTVPLSERHTGNFNTTKYRLSVSTVNHVLDIEEDYITFEGLIVRNANAAGLGCIHVVNTAGAGASDIKIKECVLRADGTGASEDGIYIQSGKVTVRNTVIPDCARHGIYADSTNGPELHVDNCSIVGSGVYGITCAAVTSVIRNTYIGNSGTGPYNIDGSATVSNCAHSSVAVVSGSTASIAYNTNNFVSVTADTPNLQLVFATADEVLKSGGANLSADFSIDIDSEERWIWGIGVDELTPYGFKLPCLRKRRHIEDDPRRTRRRPLRLVGDNPGLDVSISSLDAVAELSAEALYGTSIIGPSMPVQRTVNSELRAGVTVPVDFVEPLSLDASFGSVDTEWSYDLPLGSPDIDLVVGNPSPADSIEANGLLADVETSLDIVYGSDILISPLDATAELTAGMEYGIEQAISQLDCEPTFGIYRVIPNYGPSAKVYQEEAFTGQTVMGLSDEPFKLNKAGSAVNAGSGRPLHLSVVKPTVVEVHGMFTIDTPIPLAVDDFHYLSPGQYLLIRNDAVIAAAITQDGDTEEITLAPTPMSGSQFSLKMASIEQP